MGYELAATNLLDITLLLRFNEFVVFTSDKQFNFDELWHCLAFSNCKAKQAQDHNKNKQHHLEGASYGNVL